MSGENRAEDLACSTVSVGELAVRGSDLSVRVFLARIRKIQLSEAIAYRAAALERGLLSAGQRLGENDNWIAATALHYSATLVYTAGDFNRVEGLRRLHLSPEGPRGRGDYDR